MSGKIERPGPARTIVQREVLHGNCAYCGTAREVVATLACPNGCGEDEGYAPPGYPSAREPGELDPEWVMAGVDVPAGKRLYASKDLKGSAFQLAMDQYGNGDGWHLTTTMCHMLVITRPTYGECMAELMRIWQNWEAEGRELPAGRRTRNRAL